MVHDRLRDAIIRGEIPSDTPLSQVQLAQQFGVSRTPLREALRMLQREGLVDGEPNRRVRVRSLSLADLEQLYAMRIALEALAIRLTVPLLTAADLSHLERYLLEIERYAMVEDYDRWCVPHRAFHAGLVAHAGERVLAMTAQLADHAERYRRVYTMLAPDAWVAGARGHREIFDACAAGDMAAAADQLSRHYARVALSVIAIVAPEYEPTVVRSALRMAARV